MEYTLTDMGRRFGPVLSSIETWGNEYIAYLRTQNRGAGHRRFEAKSVPCGIMITVYFTVWGLFSWIIKNLLKMHGNALANAMAAQSAMALPAAIPSLDLARRGRGHSHPQLSGLADSPRRHGYAVRKRGNGYPSVPVWTFFLPILFCRSCWCGCHALQ